MLDLLDDFTALHLEGIDGVFALAHKVGGLAVNLLTTQPLCCEINDFIPRILFLVESQVNIHGTCHRASYHGVVANTEEAHHLHVCGYR